MFLYNDYRLDHIFGCFLMIHHTKFSMIVYLLLMLLTYSQGNLFNISEKVILVDSLQYRDCVFGMKSCDFGNDSKYYDFGSGSGYNSVHPEIDSCICYRAKQCLCKEFDDALVQLVEDNTVIAINRSIALNSRVLFSSISNVSIIGYHKAIEITCLVKRRLPIEFENCNNITIKNITWIECGSAPEIFMSISSINDYFHDESYFGLRFSFCRNVNLISCTFKNTMIEFNTVSGNISIDQVHFLSAITPGYQYLPLSTGFIMRSRNKMKVNNIVVVVEITNSLFSQINSTWNDYALLLFYILVDDPHSTITVFVENTNFLSASYKWEEHFAFVWIRILSATRASICFHNVKFQNNAIRTGTVHLNHSIALLRINIKAFQLCRGSWILSRVVIKSCSFFNNYAQKVAHFEGDMYLDVINTSFSYNKADTVVFVATSSNSHQYYRNDIYITTAIQVLQSTFFNNTGGHLISLNDDYILANIIDIQITHNVLLPEYDGLVVFQNYDTLVANITNIIYEFNNIKGEGSGFHFISNAIFEHLDKADTDYGEPYTAYIPPNFPIHCWSRICNYFYSDYQWFSFANGSFFNNTGGGQGAIIHYVMPQFGYPTIFTNMISTSTFNNNSNSESLIYVSMEGSATVQVTVKDCTFIQNEGNVFNLRNQILQFLNEKTATIFDNNRAQNGAALYLALNSTVMFTKNSAVTFSNNIAVRYGGAIYYDITQSSNACYRNLSTFRVDNETSIKFINNIAGFAGNSIYFSISQSCNGTLQYDPQTPVFNPLIEITTSSNQLQLYYPAQLVNNSDLSTYYVSDIMLGQNIIIPACVLDHYEMPAESVQFTVQLVDNNDHNYSVQANGIISIDCSLSQGINNLEITGSPPLNDINSTLTIQLNSFYDSRFDWKPITVNLNVQLSSCHSGFYYSSDLEHCVCYTTDNIVTCSDSNSTIRNGYWFGTVNEQPTVTACPINYCSFDNCEATTGTCDLYPLRDNQCRGYRSGVACGNCEEGYTLSFDSIDCIATNQCTTGQTVLVITMSFLYWITVIVVVFCMMYFKIGIGYLYGITFYYSIIDIVMGNTLLFTDSLYHLVTTLSSIAKLLPQFLGQLCIVKGLSGIDQQFLHYVHPFAIISLLVLISTSTRYSPKLSMFVSRAVIHAICLLLLLSYTSVASTSLLLVRAIGFTNVDKVYSYLSPDIEYFHGCHLIYDLVSFIALLVIVIGLPLLLLLEPFLNSKINFIKIKPLLDQFQGCYKDKFRYFASYFMIFRLIILGILVVNQTNPFIALYSLLVVCLVVALIHVTVKPYNNDILNFFDSFMLVIVVLVITLQIVEIYRGFPSNAILGVAFVLVILPLVVFLLIVAYLNVERTKNFIIHCVSVIKSSNNTEATDTEAVEMHQCEYEIIVDQQLRDKTKTTIV